MEKAEEQQKYCVPFFFFYKQKSNIGTATANPIDLPQKIKKKIGPSFSWLTHTPKKWITGQLFPT